jgi:hypothetical protein
MSPVVSRIPKKVFSFRAPKIVPIQMRGERNYYRKFFDDNCIISFYTTSTAHKKKKKKIKNRRDTQTTM